MIRVYTAIELSTIRGEVQDVIFQLGGKRFGPAPQVKRATIEGVADREELERIAGRLLDATGWDDLLTSN